MADNMQRPGSAQTSEREWNETLNRPGNGNESESFNQSNYSDSAETNQASLRQGNNRNRPYRSESYGSNYPERQSQGSSYPSQNRDWENQGRWNNSSNQGAPYSSERSRQWQENEPRQFYGNQEQWPSQLNQWSNPQFGSNYGHSGTQYSHSYGQSLPNSNYAGSNQSGNTGFGQGEAQYGGTYRQGGMQQGNYGQGGTQFGSGQYSGNSQNRNGYQGVSHKGKGPKGYHRSDERITEEINDSLTEDHMLDASQIEVNVTNAEVKLSGTVDSRESKRRAEDIAESISGVSNVENSIKVKPENSSSGQHTNSSSNGGAYSSKTQSGSSSMNDGSQNDKSKKLSNSMS